MPNCGGSGPNIQSAFKEYLIVSHWPIICIPRDPYRSPKIFSSAKRNRDGEKELQEKKASTFFYCVWADDRQP